MVGTRMRVVFMLRRSPREVCMEQPTIPIAEQVREVVQAAMEALRVPHAGGNLPVGRCQLL